MMNDYEQRGYGITFYSSHIETNTTDEKMQKLLEDAPLLKKEVLDYVHKHGQTTITVENTLDYFNSSRDYGFISLMAEVINEKLGNVVFEATEDDDGKHYLFLSAAMPWEYSNLEKKFTVQEVYDLLYHYYKMLYDDEPDIDNVSIHTYG